MTQVALPKIDQVTMPAGVAGQSRDDLVLNQVVSVTDTGSGAVRLWVMRDRPKGSAAVLSSSSGPSVTFLPDIEGTYSIRLSVDGGADSDHLYDIAAAVQILLPSWISSTLRRLRIPAFGEALEFNRFSYPQVGDNTRGWADKINEILGVLAGNAFGFLAKQAGSAVGTEPFKTINFVNGTAADGGGGQLDYTAAGGGGGSSEPYNLSAGSQDKSFRKSYTNMKRAASTPDVPYGLCAIRIDRDSDTGWLPNGRYLAYVLGNPYTPGGTLVIADAVTLSVVRWVAILGTVTPLGATFVSSGISDVLLVAGNFGASYQHLNLTTGVSTLVTPAGTPAKKPGTFFYDGSILWTRDGDDGRLLYCTDPTSATPTWSANTNCECWAGGDQGFASDGVFLYAIVWDGSILQLAKIPLSTPGAVPTILASYAATYIDPRGLVYDGKSLWAVFVLTGGSTSKLLRLAAADGAIVGLSVTTGGSSPIGMLAFDGRYVWHIDSAVVSGHSHARKYDPAMPLVGTGATTDLVPLSELSGEHVSTETTISVACVDTGVGTAAYVSVIDDSDGSFHIYRVSDLQLQRDAPYLLGAGRQNKSHLRSPEFSVAKYLSSSLACPLCMVDINSADNSGWLPRGSYVAGIIGTTLYLWDTASMATVKTVALGALGADLMMVFVASGGSHALLIEWSSATYLHVNLGTGVATAVSHALKMGIHYDGAKAWSGGSGEIYYCADPISATPTWSANTNLGTIDSAHLCMASDGKYLYVVGGQGGLTNPLMLFRLPLDTPTAVPECLFSFPTEMQNNYGMACDGKSLWMICDISTGGGYLRRFDLDTRQFVGEFSTKTWYPLVFDGRYIWAASYVGSTTHKFDPSMPGLGAVLTPIFSSSVAGANLTARASGESTVAFASGVAANTLYKSVSVFDSFAASITREGPQVIVPTRHAAGTTYDMLGTEGRLIVTTGGGSPLTEVRLPGYLDASGQCSLADGLVVEVQDGNGFAGTFPVAIRGKSGATGYQIAGADTVNLNINRAVYSMVFDKTNGVWLPRFYTQASGGGGGGVGYGLLASRPTPGTAGQRYVASDAMVSDWVDDGTSWRPLISGVMGIEPPLVSAFTGMNVGTTTFTQQPGSGFWVGPSEGATNVFRGRGHALSSSTAYVECAFAVVGDSDPSPSGKYCGVYAFLRNGDTNQQAFGGGIYVDLNVRAFYQMEMEWASNTAASIVTRQNLSGGLDSNLPVFYRIRRDGTTTLYIEQSRDRKNWVVVYTRTYSSVFSLGAPTQVGIASWSSGVAVRFSLLHYAYGSY